MNRPERRPGWVKYALLGVLAAGGAAGGFYLAGVPGEHLPVSGCDPRPEPSPVALTSHRFALTAHDAKDTMEAPEVAVDAAGNVFLAWASKTGDAERTIFVTRSTDGGKTFTAANPVSKGGVYRTAGHGGKPGFERRATPHLGLTDGKAHLSWSEALPGGTGMRMVLATSSDNAATFGQPAPTHQGAGAKATFTSLARGANGALACAWLDDRNGAQQVFASVRPAGATAFEPELLVYAGQDGKGVCHCCPTAAAFGPDGTLYVAFRGADGGYRDVSVSSLRPGRVAFEGPFPVCDRTWKFDGCPHDGPSIVVVGDTLHVAWMDARSGSQRCYHARAKAADMKFESRELHPGTHGTQGNAKLTVDSSGTLHAVWEATLGNEPAPEGHSGHQHGPPKVGAGGGRAVMHAVMPPGQAAFGNVRAIAPKAGAFQTRPGIAVVPNGNLLVTWNELDASGKAVVATLVPPPLPDCCRE